MRSVRGGPLLRALWSAALEAVDPRRLVRAALEAPDVRRAVAGARRVGVFAVGKAAVGMARGAADVLGARSRLVVAPEGAAPRATLAGAGVLAAAHPEPDSSSVRAARRALAFFRAFGAEDAIVCLVSGGASSLLALPRPGMTLAEQKRRVAALVRSGAPILAVNRLRCALSAVKCGRLGRATDARLITLVLSDVPGDRAAAVGSGPTVRGRRGDVVRVIGSNAAGLAAAAREARRRGLAVRRPTRRLSGEATAAGRRLARALTVLPPKTALLAGGETTVRLGRSFGRRGRGGRSLELALAAAEVLAGGPAASLLAAGSDGIDGSSDAAGAFVDETTAARARRVGLDPDRALTAHDSDRFFRRLGLLFRPGPTGTNVADWVFGVRR